MHIAFSMMVGLPAASLVRHRIPRVIWRRLPAGGLLRDRRDRNHYWFDAAAGALVACPAAVAARQLARLRPDAWSWRGDALAEEATA